MKLIVRLITALALLVLVAWSALIVTYAPVFSRNQSYIILAALFLTFVLSLVPKYGRTFFRAILLLEVILVIYCWAGVEPRSDRLWAPEYARMPSFKIDGDTVTVSNIRNIQYKNENESVLQYYDKTVKLSELSGLDIFVSYWAGKSIAHVMISFGFADKDFLAVSIETRREANESYSTLAGFFRNYELIYVVADERDLIRLRTIYRQPPESVYLLRTNMALATARRFFLDYAAAINKLSRHPEFYNTVLTNCTSQVLFHTRVNKDSLPYNWKILFSGYVPEYLHEIKALAPDMSLEELMERGKVNESSMQAGASEDFSVRIREGVPRPAPVAD